MSTSDLLQEEWKNARAFFPPGCLQEEATRLARNSTARAANEHGESVVLSADTPANACTPLDIPIFQCFIRAGLVPPMSPFLRAVLEKYGLCLAQLHPSAVVTLAFFQHLCEAFVGVTPSVALFRHFFVPRVEAGDPTSGSVRFFLRLGRAEDFIPLAQKQWDDWRREWVFVRFPEPHAALSVPTSAVGRRDNWDELGPRDADFAPVRTKIFNLKQQGLTQRHVVAHYLGNRLAPLQLRSRPAWLVTRLEDTTRLAPGRSVQAEPGLSQRVSWLVGETLGAGPDPLPGSVIPVAASPQLSFVLAEMPHCDEWGVIPEEEDDVGALAEPPLPPPPPGPPPPGAVRFLDVAAPSPGPLAQTGTWG